MSRVKVILYGRFRDVVKKRELAVEAKSVSELLDILTIKFGNKFRNELLDKEGTLRPFYNILVNGTKIDFKKKLDTELKESDIVAFFSPIAGG